MLIETLSQQIDESALRGTIDAALWVYIYTPQDREEFELWQDCYEGELRTQEYNGWRLVGRRRNFNEWFVESPSGKVFFFTSHRKTRWELERDFGREFVQRAL